MQQRLQIFTLASHEKHCLLFLLSFLFYFYPFFNVFLDHLALVWSLGKSLCYCKSGVVTPTVRPLPSQRKSSLIPVSHYEVPGLAHTSWCTYLFPTLHLSKANWWCKSTMVGMFTALERTTATNQPSVL